MNKLGYRVVKNVFGLVKKYFEKKYKMFGA